MKQHGNLYTCEQCGAKVLREMDGCLFTFTQRAPDGWFESLPAGEAKRALHWCSAKCVTNWHEQGAAGGQE